MKNFNEFGIAIPEILLPKNKDLTKWSVIACDQYTQDEDYWNNVKKCVGNNPSTLNLILPEVYLSSPDKSERIAKIRTDMKEYLAEGVFDSPKQEFLYIERKTGYGRIRKGLIVAIDLDSYEWVPFSKAYIRATEATIVERIPPRKEIRNGAPLESPHIMLLVNDEKKSLVEAIGKTVKEKTPVYDSDLMLDAGHITGWTVEREAEMNQVYDALNQLKKKNTSADGSTFMFAVGDGNHSLATAKTVWEEYKKQQLENGVSLEEVNKSNVRYALVEIVNIYDDGLTFEPIHRVMFDSDVKALMVYVANALNGTMVAFENQEQLEKSVKASNADFGFVYVENGVQQYKCVKTSIKELAVSKLQPVLDKFISENKAVKIDYIHGSEEVFRLGAKENACSILLPPIAKNSFFETINSTGPLPRKSFSMGEASEKRFYLECRKLFN